MAIDHYDRDGNPISFEEYCAKFSDHDYKRIAYTEIPETDIQISTVWLGIDHNFGLEDPRPVIFETMIFGGEHNDWQDRYCTEDEARQGHLRAVELVVGHAIVLGEVILQELENAVPDVQREPTDPNGGRT